MGKLNTLGSLCRKKKEIMFTVAVKFYEKSCHVIIKCVKDNMKSKTDRKLYILLWKLNTLWCSFVLSLRIYNLGRYIYSDNFVLYTSWGHNLTLFLFVCLSSLICILTSEFLHLDFYDNPTDLPDLMLSLSSAGHAL